MAESPQQFKSPKGHTKKVDITKEVYQDYHAHQDKLRKAEARKAKKG